MMAAEKSGAPPQEKATVKAINIPLGVAKGEVVFYSINVRTAYTSWSITKRYSQFEELGAALIEIKGLPATVELPGKRYKLFVSHISKEFIEERRVLLENYLKKLITVDDVQKCDAFLKFVSTDKSDEEVKVDVKKESDLAEDSEITGISIPATRTMSDHVLYQIDIVNSRKRKSFSKWTVLKRFGQFYDMDCAVRACYAEKPEMLDHLPGPPARRAKLLNDHMDAAFVEARRVLLENYLQKMLQVDFVLRNKEFLTFLGVNV